jgi:RNA polymerase sigma-70 factor, ECF subfamily
MERHAQKLLHCLVRSLQDESDAADLAQETFVKVYQNRARFDPRQKFTTWLYAIASNLVRKTRPRKNKRSMEGGRSIDRPPRWG